MNDDNSFSMATAPFLKSGGMTTVRFPAGSAYGDLYHWSTNTPTPYKGIANGYWASGSTFASVVQLVDKIGTTLGVVNYGSNQAGTGGGEPCEAAAWVAYANGDPSDGKGIGKDSGGHDWGTVGKWALIRSQVPLSVDDGFNSLRIGHPAPLNIRLWQIGNQVYNNGYYGGEHVGEPDLHAPAPAGPKDFGKLHKNPSLSPTFYGARLIEFAGAMKAVDPNILIGASLVTPPDAMIWASDWNSSVLKKACQDIDFVTLEWVTGTVMPPDWKTLDESNLLGNVRSQLNTMFAAVLSEDKASCPKNHTPRIAFSPAGVIPYPKVDRPVVEALWVADVYALLVESGSVNISLPSLYSDIMISNDRKKVGPAYLGMQMLHYIAHIPGDAMVDATSSNSNLAAHATMRRDGVFGLMLVNKDPASAMAVKVNILGGQVGTKARRFDYGIAQQKAGSGITPVKMDDVSGDFLVTVPAYTITDILIEK